LIAPIGPDRRPPMGPDESPDYREIHPDRAPDRAPHVLRTHQPWLHVSPFPAQGEGSSTTTPQQKQRPFRFTSFGSILKGRCCSWRTVAIRAWATSASTPCRSLAGSSVVLPPPGPRLHPFPERRRALERNRHVSSLSARPKRSRACSCRARRACSSSGGSG